MVACEARRWLGIIRIDMVVAIVEHCMANLVNEDIQLLLYQCAQLECSRYTTLPTENCNFLGIHNEIYGFIAEVSRV